MWLFLELTIYTEEKRASSSSNVASLKLKGNAVDKEIYLLEFNFTFLRN